tara:strand:- start:4542 stop:6272 length:1731 start_codon:yes stop_codon:yes gene_type:complete
MSDSENKEELSFQDDKGASRSTWIAAILVVVIVAWMGSGYLLPSEDSAVEQAEDAPIEPVAVAVERASPEQVTISFQAEGQAQPDRDTSIRAEASGDVVEVMVMEGEEVAGGTVIARLSATRAEADLSRAREEFARAQREFKNATELLNRGVATADRVSQARATLAGAEASVTAAEEAIEALAITAPFAGQIEELSLDAGEFIQAGSEVGRVVDNRPLTVALQVPQQALGQIKSGQTATVNFITGEEREGTVSFVSTAANAETRTFLTKITVPNENGAIPAGISAEIRIPTGSTSAHFVQPSTISLSPEGRLGVKTVDDSDTVVFTPVSIVRAEIDGLYVTGLPEEVRIIIIGQGFVNAGERVTPSLQTDPDRDAGSRSSQGSEPALPLPETEPSANNAEQVGQADTAPVESTPVETPAGVSPDTTPEGATTDSDETDESSAPVTSDIAEAPEAAPENTQPGDDVAPSTPPTDANPSSDAAAPAPSENDSAEQPLISPPEIDDGTSALRSVQERLNLLGYDAGPADGFMGPQTETALEEFRAQRGLDETGEATTRTLEELGEAIRERGTQPLASGR